MMMIHWTNKIKLFCYNTDSTMYSKTIVIKFSEVPVYFIAVYATRKRLQYTFKNFYSSRTWYFQGQKSWRHKRVSRDASLENDACQSVFWESIQTWWTSSFLACSVFASSDLSLSTAISNSSHSFDFFRSSSSDFTKLRSNSETR